MSSATEKKMNSSFCLLRGQMETTKWSQTFPGSPSTLCLARLCSICTKCSAEAPPPADLRSLPWPFPGKGYLQVKMQGGVQVSGIYKYICREMFTGEVLTGNYRSILQSRVNREVKDLCLCATNKYLDITDAHKYVQAMWTR